MFPLATLFQLGRRCAPSHLHTPQEREHEHAPPLEQLLTAFNTRPADRSNQAVTNASDEFPPSALSSLLRSAPTPILTPLACSRHGSRQEQQQPSQTTHTAQGAQGAGEEEASVTPLTPPPRPDTRSSSSEPPANSHKSRQVENSSALCTSAGRMSCGGSALHLRSPRLALPASLAAVGATGLPPCPAAVAVACLRCDRQWQRTRKPLHAARTIVHQGERATSSNSVQSAHFGVPPCLRALLLWLLLWLCSRDGEARSASFPSRHPRVDGDSNTAKEHDAVLATTTFLSARARDHAAVRTGRRAVPLPSIGAPRAAGSHGSSAREIV